MDGSNIRRVIRASAFVLAFAACDQEALLDEDLDEQLDEQLAERLAEAPAENLAELGSIEALVDPADDPVKTTSCAVMYEHINFGGGTLWVAHGAYTSWIGNYWNDKVSSVYVFSGCALNVYEHIDFGGAHKTIAGFAPWVGGWWNDRISSYTCTC